MLERQHAQLTAGLQELYRRTQTGDGRIGPRLEVEDHVQPLTQYTRISRCAGNRRVGRDGGHRLYLAGGGEARAEQQRLDVLGNRFASYASYLLPRFTDSNRLFTIDNHVKEAIEVSEWLAAHHADSSNAAPSYD